MGDVLDTVMEVVVIGGALLVLLAGVGVLRFPDLYARMHAATKASTPAIGLIGLAAAVVLDHGRAQSLLAVAFIFVTAPTAAHFIGRAAYRAEGIEVDLVTRDDLAALVDRPEGTPDRRPGPPAGPGDRTAADDDDPGG